MFEAFLLLLLGTWCTVSGSQPVLTQESSVSASPGQTVKLTCSMSSGFPVQNQDQSWYQQKPGNPPKFIVYYWSSPHTGSGEFSRFSSSKESSQNTWYLTISNVQEQDEAVYYCAVRYTSGNVYVFGGGTTLFVTGGSPVPPNVHLYPPSPEEIESKGKATFVCLIHDFSPPGITVTWQADSNTISNGVETTKPMKVNEKYVSSSYLTLDPSVWKSSKHVTCKVRHEGNDYGKSVSHAECP